MGFEADMRIVGPRPRSRDENQHRVQSRRFVGPSDQFTANAVSLEIPVNSKIRQIGCKAEVGQCPRNADEFSVDPRGDDHIRAGYHLLQARRIIDRSAFTQCGGHQYGAEFLHGELWLQRIAHRTHSHSATTG